MVGFKKALRALFAEGRMYDSEARNLKPLQHLDGGNSALVIGF